MEVHACPAAKHIDHDGSLTAADGRSFVARGESLHWEAARLRTQHCEQRCGDLSFTEMMWMLNACRRHYVAKEPSVTGFQCMLDMSYRLIPLGNMGDCSIAWYKQSNFLEVNINLGRSEIWIMFGQAIFLYCMRAAAAEFLPLNIINEIIQLTLLEFYCLPDTFIRCTRNGVRYL